MKNQREISLKIEKRLEEKCEKYGEVGAISCIKFKKKRRYNCIFRNR